MLFRSHHGLRHDECCGGEFFQQALHVVQVVMPVVRAAAKKTRLAVIYFGSTSPAMDEALEALGDAGIHLDALRLRAFPFAPSVAEFIAAHDQVFMVEQNRDAQMRTLLVTELEVDPAKLAAVLHYDGTPITARFITAAITKHVHALAVTPRTEKTR